MTERNFPTIGETLYTEQLENGLTICVVPKPDYEKCFAFFATNYGGMDMIWQEQGVEHTTPAGVAHYLEHKMFDTKEGNALQTLSGNGASANAFTASDITGYYFECTEGFSQNLRTLLSFVSVPYFTKESVAKEQGIIGQEIRMIEDDPNWQLFQNLLSSLYVRHPLRHSVAGTVESISHITADTLYRCHKTFYHPGNMILVVTGNIKHPRSVVEMARVLLPHAHQAPPEHFFGKPEPEQAAHPLCQVEMAVASTNCLIGFKADPPQHGPEALRTLLVGELACELLCGDASPLYAKLYAEGLVNKTFGCDYTVEPKAAYLAAGGECQEPETLRQLLIQEGQRLSTDGIDPDRFRRTRRACYGSRVRALNSFEHICVQLTRGQFQGYDYFTFGQVYSSITPQEVASFLGRTVTQKRSALSVVTPKSPQ